jgi:hypothetical protein
MKRIINGKTYNVHTSTEICGEDNAEYSGAWWSLYQTRHGEFFKVMMDHDGETFLEFGPVSDEEARKLAEKYAPVHVVEQFFGPYPEGGAGERRMTIRIPENLAARLEAAAKAKNLSLNAYAMRCFESCVRFDGLGPTAI